MIKLNNSHFLYPIFSPIIIGEKIGMSPAGGGVGGGETINSVANINPFSAVALKVEPQSKIKTG